MKSHTRIFATLSLGLCIWAFAGCDDTSDAPPPANPGPAERAGEQIDRSAEKAGEQIDRGAEKAGEQIQRGADKADDALDRAGREVDDRLDRARNSTPATRPTTQPSDR